MLDYLDRISILCYVIKGVMFRLDGNMVQRVSSLEGFHCTVLLGMPISYLTIQGC